MPGKHITEDHRVILGKLLQLPQLKNREIAWVLDYDLRTIQRKRKEFVDTGEVKKKRDVSMNAEKLKSHHLEVRRPATYLPAPGGPWPVADHVCARQQKLLAWHRDHPDALLQDMVFFLEKHFDLKLSNATLSRRLKQVYGTHMKTGRSARLRARKRREEDGCTYAMEIEASVLENNNNNPAPPADMYHDQRQLAPIREILEPPREAPHQGPQDQGPRNEALHHHAQQHQAQQYQGPQYQTPQYQAPPHQPQQQHDAPRDGPGPAAIL